MDDPSRARAAPTRLLRQLPHHLLDLPDLLTLDGFEAGIWSRLPREARFSFKHTCRRGRQLAESLVTSASLLPGYYVRRRQAQQQAVADHVATVSRLPRLTSLTLSRCWPNEVELVGVLSRYGEASAGRVTRLTLTEQQLSHAALLVISQAFPKLAELQLHHIDTSVSPEDGLKLHGALFLPLHGGRLAKLTMKKCVISRDAVASLAGLTALELLHAHSLHATPPADLRPLSSLRRLRHCDISVSKPVSLVDAAALFSATGLTSLRISNVRSDSLAGSSHTAPEIAAALALLADLASLQSLNLGPNYVVDDATLSALGRLPHLTRLCIASIATAASPPTPGHLPRLRTLQVGAAGQVLNLSRLLQTLQALLPLPALTTLVEGRLRLDMGCDPPDDPDADPDDGAAAAHAADLSAAHQAATLTTLMTHLAAAPHLGSNPYLMLTGERSQNYLNLSEVVEALQPLGASLLTLATWGDVELGGTNWGRVHECLPGLTELRLDGQHSSGWDVPAMVRHLPAVARLELYLSDATSGDQAMWLRLAEECGRRVDFETELPEETAALCRAVQERVHGAVTFNW